MKFNDIYILVTVLVFCSIGMGLSPFLYFRNIYTQKILFLNEHLSRMTNEGEISSFRISNFYSWNIKILGESQYPPTINSKFLKNRDYKALIEEFQAKLTWIEKFVKLIVKIYFTIMTIVFAIDCLSFL